MKEVRTFRVDKRPAILAISLLVALQVLYFVPSIGTYFGLLEKPFCVYLRMLGFVVVWLFLIRTIWRRQRLERFWGYRALHNPIGVNHLLGTGTADGELLSGYHSIPAVSAAPVQHSALCPAADTGFVGMDEPWVAWAGAHTNMENPTVTRRDLGLIELCAILLTCGLHQRYLWRRELAIAVDGS